jgi:hypothetical protein
MTMKVGDVVKVLQSCGGPGGSLVGSSDYKTELVVVTEKNIEFLDAQLYAGFVEMYEVKPIKTEVVVKDETPDVLPDEVVARKRGRKRSVRTDVDGMA